MIIEIAASTLWTSLAILNGQLAENKGDRGFKWFLLSLPLGPLGQRSHHDATGGEVA